MPTRRLAIFGPRRKREKQPRIGGEKAETGREDADHGSGNTVYANLLSEHMGVGVELLVPKCVGKNGDVIGFRSAFLICECASDHGAERESKEKIRRDAHGGVEF